MYTPATETAKWHGTFLAFVASPIPADGAKRPLGLLRGCGSGGKVSRYRGREISDSLTHGNKQALQEIERKSHSQIPR